MEVKTRMANKDGATKLETSGTIKEILINEDILHPQQESVALCFRGQESSGIVELTPQEIDMLYEKIQSKRHLFKKLKKLPQSGAIRF